MSGIRLNQVIFGEIEFKRIPAITTELKYSLDIKVEHSIGPAEDDLQVQMRLNVAEDAKQLNISCLVVGAFSGIKDLEGMSLEDFIAVNAPAMLYPYCRELVASITLRAGLPPLLLQPMNFTKLGK